MKPILFLDIDGVLNEFGSQPQGGLLGISQAHVARLKRILDTVPTDVVLSSTWRKVDRNLAKVESMLDGIGHELYGMTNPEVRAYRALEIHHWLELNPHRARFVVLDDDVFPADFPDANQVHTDGFNGALTDAKADEVIRKLQAT